MTKLFRSIVALFFAFFAIHSYARNSPNIDRIDKYLFDNIQNGVSASILVAKGNDLLISKGYGFANREAKTANSSSTVFDIGSLTKQFTAAAILKLAEEEKIKLVSTLGDYFKGLSNEKSKITIHQLLIHTAGFEEYPGSDFDSISKETYFQKVFLSKLRFTPGSRYEYSNVGYSILAAIIEKVSQTDYETFLSQKFFKPLNMANTGYLIPDWSNTTLAYGYYQDFFDRGTSIERYSTNGVSPILWGNGGIQSTVTDLHKWLVALKDNKVLSENSNRLLTKKYIGVPTQIKAFQTSTFYGYGWTIGSNSYSSQVISHGGSNGVYRSSIIWRPKEKVFVIFLSNTQSDGTLWLAYEIDKMLAEPDYQPKPIKPSPYRVIDDYLNKTKSVSGSDVLKYFETRTGSTIESSDFLNRLSMIYLRYTEHTDWALELLKLNVRIFPDDGNLWDSLGEGYIKIGEKDLALDSFKKALKIAPGENCYWCESAQKNIVKFSAD